MCFYDLSFEFAASLLVSGFLYDHIKLCELAFPADLTCLTFPQGLPLLSNPWPIDATCQHPEIPFPFFQIGYLKVNGRCHCYFVQFLVFATVKFTSLNVHFGGMGGRAIIWGYEVGWFHHRWFTQLRWGKLKDKMKLMVCERNLALQLVTRWKIWLALSYTKPTPGWTPLLNA